MAEKEVTPSNRLCPLEMCITRHEVVDVLLCTLGNDFEEIHEVLFDENQLITEPHAHISSYLIVATSACV